MQKYTRKMHLKPLFQNIFRDIGGLCQEPELIGRKDINFQNELKRTANILTHLTQALNLEREKMTLGTWDYSPNRLRQVIWVIGQESDILQTQHDIFITLNTFSPSKGKKHA